MRLVTTAVKVASLQAGALQRPVNQLLMVGMRESDESPVRMGMRAGVFKQAAASGLTPTAVIVFLQFSDLKGRNDVSFRCEHKDERKWLDSLGRSKSYQSRKDNERQHDGRNNKDAR